MLRTHWIMLLTLSMIGVAGCGDKPEGPETPGPSQTSTEPTESEPQAALREFLDAIRKGEDQAVERMLTRAARETTRSLDLHLSPSRSDTAQFEIGPVEYVGEDGARVACVLSDLGSNDERRTDELVWMLRHEPEGWRIAGFAATMVEGEPPKKLDFENPEEMRLLKAARDSAQARVPSGDPNATPR